VSEQPSPDELADALDNVRTAIRDGEVPAVDASLPIVMAEFDRRGLVERAATALVEHCRAGVGVGPGPGAKTAELLTALTDALNGGKS
jgi:hypothetical protein